VTHRVGYICFVLHVAGYSTRNYATRQCHTEDFAERKRFWSVVHTGTQTQHLFPPAVGTTLSAFLEEKLPQC